MQHQPQITLHSYAYSLADPPQFAHRVAFRLGNRRFEGTKQKGTCQPYLLNRLPYNSGLERVNVSGNIG